VCSSHDREETAGVQLSSSRGHWCAALMIERTLLVSTALMIERRLVCSSHDREDTAGEHSSHD
jgi:hypothetical protein